MLFWGLWQRAQNNKKRTTWQSETLLKTSWDFSKLLLALLCHQLGELFILARLKICLPSVPFYSSAGLMFNVSVLMASSAYSTMTISTSGNQQKQWRRETLAAWMPSKQAFIWITCSVAYKLENGCEESSFFFFFSNLLKKLQKLRAIMVSSLCHLSGTLSKYMSVTYLCDTTAVFMIFI